MALLEMPEDTVCPISQTVMEDPVICADGHSYERSCIKQWLEVGRCSSPKTNMPLAYTTIIPNTTMRDIISVLTIRMEHIRADWEGLAVAAAAATAAAEGRGREQGLAHGASATPRQQGPPPIQGQVGRQPGEAEEAPASSSALRACALEFVPAQAEHHLAPRNAEPADLQEKDDSILTFCSNSGDEDEDDEGGWEAWLEEKSKEEEEESPSQLSEVGEPEGYTPWSAQTVRAHLRMPEALICPLSKQVMKDPVVCADGYSYERAYIELRLRWGLLMSPRTKRKLPHRMLVPNVALRNLIDALERRLPALRAEWCTLRVATLGDEAAVTVEPDDDPEPNPVPALRPMADDPEFPLSPTPDTAAILSKAYNKLPRRIAYDLLDEGLPSTLASTLKALNLEPMRTFHFASHSRRVL